MDIKNIITEKGSYFPPIIEKIMLDNEISLALESFPPDGPGEVLNNSINNFNNNPYQNLA